VQSTRDAPVEAGELYRVLACDMPNATGGCLSSTVYFVPVIPKRDADLGSIPARVVVELPDGTEQGFIVEKNHGRLSQLLQYNVYMLVKTLANAAVMEMPPMTTPKDDQGPRRDALNESDWVQINVHQAYDGARGIDGPPAIPPMTPRGYEFHSPTDWHPGSGDTP
jgi:hypothetical protein